MTYSILSGSIRKIGFGVKENIEDYRYKSSMFYQNVQLLISGRKRGGCGMRITPNIDSGIFLRGNGYGVKHEKRQINVP